MPVSISPILTPARLAAIGRNAQKSSSPRTAAVMVLALHDVGSSTLPTQNRVLARARRSPCGRTHFVAGAMKRRPPLGPARIPERYSALRRTPEKRILFLTSEA